MPPRTITPALAFQASLKLAQARGGATITKGEAENALAQLDAAGSAAERASIVQAFLDTSGAAALSERARRVLVDFVKQQEHVPATGAGALEVKLAARSETVHAEHDLARAKKKLESLIARGASDLAGLEQVRAWLDAAGADVREAKSRLTTMADDAAKAARRQLDAAGRDLGHAATDLDKLIEKAKTGRVSRAQLEELRAWLAQPLPELDDAALALAAGKDHKKAQGSGADTFTVKYPSDQEDQGGGGSVDVTMKYPSDNEDGGGTPIGTLKDKKLSAASTNAMRKAYEKAAHAKAISWRAGGVVESHVGERFARVVIAHAHRGAITAFVPLGALTPTAPDLDPNQVDRFFVERTDGDRRRWAGPLFR